MPKKKETKKYTMEAKRKRKKPYEGGQSQKIERYIYNRFVLGQNKKKAALNAGYSETTANGVLLNIEKSKYYEYLLNTALQRDDLIGELNKINKQDKSLDTKHKALRTSFELLGDLNQKEKETKAPTLKLIISEKEGK